MRWAVGRRWNGRAYQAVDVRKLIINDREEEKDPRHHKSSKKPKKAKEQPDGQSKRDS